jgi:hypothetical protein
MTMMATSVKIRSLRELSLATNYVHPEWSQAASVYDG